MPRSADLDLYDRAAVAQRGDRTSTPSSTWRPASARSTCSTSPRSGRRTTGSAPRRRATSSTRRSPPTSRRTCSRRSPSSTSRTGRRRRTRRSARSWPILRSALVAEQETAALRRRTAGAASCCASVCVDGPGTGHDEPITALRREHPRRRRARTRCSSALTLPSGIYNVVRDGERVSNERFTSAVGWHPEH